MPNHESPWWRSGVIYQIYPRSFQDSNGDGVGDLPGIARRLDYLRWLGIDAIWLSPFYPSPGADFGYDVSNYVDVDPLFGTLADFDALLAGAHVRGLKLIIDFVPNHSSDQHPWFQESRSSRDNPKRNWYIWRGPKPDGSPPNNWLAAFGGPAWTFDRPTGQYYLHSFLPQQPDLNWRNVETKNAMINAMRFWLDRGVDGFRIDVAHFLMKDPELRDNPPNPNYVRGQSSGGHKALGELESQIHLYDHAHPDIHPLYQEIRRMIDSYDAIAPRVTIGEIHEWNLSDWARFYGANLDEIHLPFNFGLLKTRWQAAQLRSHVATMEKVVPPGAWPNYVLGNHDEHRVATRIGPENARAGMMLLLTLRGTPTVYYGDELGMENVGIPADREQDPWGIRVPGLGLGRDPERTPMQWDGTANAGFSDANTRPWLPLEDDFVIRNVDREQLNADSMLSLTRRLLAIRKAHPALSVGDYHELPDSPEEVFAFERSAGGERFAIVLNLSDSNRHMPLPGTGELVISTLLDQSGSPENRGVDLRPHEGVIVKLSR